MDQAWSRSSRYLMLVIVLVFLAGLVYYARALINPLIVAALLAYVLDPAVGFLVGKLRMRRKFAVVLVYVVFLVVLASIPAILTPVLIVQLDDIRQELVNIQQGLERLMLSASIMWFPILPSDTQTGIQDMISMLFDPQRFFGVITAATENLGWILIILVTTFYFLLDGERLRDWLYNLAPGPYQEDVVRLHLKVKAIWHAYLRGQLLLMFIIGTMTWLMAMIVGMRGSLLIGFTAGALDVIPSLGPMVAAIIAVLIAYFDGSNYLPLSNLWFAVLVMGLFMGIQAFENVWLRPRILSQSLRLHPALVFVAIIGALALAGVVAALVIVPLISTAEVLGRYIFRRILGQDPWAERETLSEPAAEEIPLEPAVEVSAQPLASSASGNVQNTTES